jgi:hypothetical protein
MRYRATFYYQGEAITYTLLYAKNKHHARLAVHSTMELGYDKVRIIKERRRTPR